MKRKLICTTYFIILEKKDFQESTPKTQLLMFGLAQMSHFGLWDIIPRVAMVREKVLENEKISRSGKSQGITFSVWKI